MARATSCEPTSWTRVLPSRTEASRPRSPPLESAEPSTSSPGGRSAVEGFVQAAQPGQGHEVDHRGGVVRFEEVVDFGDGAAVCHEGLAHGADNPLRVGVADGGDPWFRRVSSRKSSSSHSSSVCAVTLRSTALIRADGSGADDGAGQAHGLVQGSVRRDAHGQQLVGADPQGVEDGRVQLVQRPVNAAGQDGVVGPLAAQGPVAQLGGEAGVALVQPVVADPGRAAPGWRRRPPRRRRAGLQKPPAGRDPPGGCAGRARSR